MALTPLRNLPARPWTLSVRVQHGINRKSRERKAEKPRQCRGFSCAAEPMLGWSVAPGHARRTNRECLASSLAAVALASLATSRALSATFCAALAVASLACAAASVAASLALSAALAVASAALSSACWVSAAACSEAAAVLSAASRVASAALSTASRAAAPALSAACCASCLACSASGPLQAARASSREAASRVVVIGRIFMAVSGTAMDGDASLFMPL